MRLRIVVHEHTLKPTEGKRSAKSAKYIAGNFICEPK